MLVGGDTERRYTRLSHAILNWFMLVLAHRLDHVDVLSQCRTIRLELKRVVVTLGTFACAGI
jgi:hypothetical protein